MIPLPVISCDGCGLCCTTVGTPPGLFAAYASPRADDAYLADAEDRAIWLTMPESLRDELRTFYAAQSLLPAEEARCESGLPCIWYDETRSKRCRNYEYRPEVCREFEMGEEDCLRMRLEACQ